MVSGRGWTGSKWIRPERRCAIYDRDRWTCAYCGARTLLSLDHLSPCGVGPWDHRSANLTTVCLLCNSRRQHRPLRAWLWALAVDGRDPIAILTEIRRRRRAPVDLARGRALLADPAVIRLRRAAGHALRSAFAGPELPPPPLTDYDPEDPPF